MPFYIVCEQNGDKPTKRLVKAKNQAQALRAVVEPRFTVEAADTEQAVMLMKQGVEVVEAQ